MFCVGTNRNVMKTQVLEGTYGKQMENTGVAYEPVENAMCTKALIWKLWKTYGKHKCCVGIH